MRIDFFGNAYSLSKKRNGGYRDIVFYFMDYRKE